MIKRIILTSIVSLILAGCTPQAPSIATPGLPETGAVAGQPIQSQFSIKMAGYAYFPDSLTVSPGTTISITNDDFVFHTITSDDGEFDSGKVQPGIPGSVTAPNRSGRFPYHCISHQDMKGVIIVE